MVCWRTISSWLSVVHDSVARTLRQTLKRTRCSPDSSGDALQSRSFQTIEILIRLSNAENGTKHVIYKKINVRSLCHVTHCQMDVSRPLMSHHNFLAHPPQKVNTSKFHSGLSAKLTVRDERRQLHEAQPTLKLSHSSFLTPENVPLLA